MDTAEIAKLVQLHPNGVRTHLERLHAAGLVERSRAHGSRGRPRDAWKISSDARPGGAAPTGFHELGRWLARTIPARPTRLREVESAGREIGRELASAPARGQADDPILDTLVALGFQPRVDRPSDESVTYCLANCPYRDAVHENQEVVCTLHRGITRGLLDALAPNAKLADFVPRDPDTAGCLIEVTGWSSKPRR